MQITYVLIVVLWRLHLFFGISIQGKLSAIKHLVPFSEFFSIYLSSLVAMVIQVATSFHTPYPSWSDRNVHVFADLLDNNGLKKFSDLKETFSLPGISYFLYLRLCSALCAHGVP